MSRAALALSGLLILAGCGSKPPAVPEQPKPIAVSVSVIASPDLNPNREGRPSPVFLRLLVLRDGTKFLDAGFDEVTGKLDQTLAGSLIGRDERLVQPGVTLKIPLEIAPEARMLGVVAEFADLPASRWRASTALTAESLKDHTLRVVVGRQSVSADLAALQGP